MASLDNSSFINLSDFKHYFRLFKKRVTKIALLCGLITFFCLLFIEPKYQARATFKEASSRSEPYTFIKNLFKTSSFSDIELPQATTIFLSRFFLKEVIHELGLQATVVMHRPLLSSMVKNIKLELGFPIEESSSFEFEKVEYAGEHCLEVYLRFTGENDFEVYSKDKNLLGKGSKGMTFVSHDFSFCLIKTIDQIRTHHDYLLRLTSWSPIVDSLQKKIVIKKDRADKTLLHLHFKHRDRHFSSKFLNFLMRHYLSYLERENKVMAKEQLFFLEQRKEELGRHMDKALQEQVAFFKKNLDEKGYLGMNQELKLISKPQEKYHQRLIDLDLDIKKIEKGENISSLTTDKPNQSRHLDLLTTSLSELKEQKKLLCHSPQYDSLKLKLFEIDQQNLSLKWSLFSEKLEAMHLSRPLSKLDTPTIDSHDFEGIDLAVLEQLHIEYQKELHTAQIQQNQLNFAIHHIEEPTFELTSLFTCSLDDISLGLIQKASDIALKSRDEKCFSLKDQSRFKEQLFTQKKFLKHHLRETGSLLKERIHFLREKIQVIKKVMTDLIDQKIVLLEEHLQEKLSEKKDELRNEKELVEMKLDEIIWQMKGLTDRWAIENKLKLQTELSLSMMEGISQFVESKTISGHLHQIGSKPLDPAYVPLSAIKPHLLSLSLLSALLGGVISFGFLLGKSLYQGVYVSMEKLKTLGFHTSGTLSSFADQSKLDTLSSSDITTLKNMIFFISQKKFSLFGLFLNGGPDYSEGLAQLLSQKGFKVYCLGYSQDMPHSKFLSLIEEVKKQYNIVLLITKSHLTSVETLSLYQLTEGAAVSLGVTGQEELQCYMAKETTFISIDEGLSKKKDSRHWWSGLFRLLSL